MTARNIVRWPAALLGLSVLWLLLLCGPALAHAGILKASPEYDEDVSKPPEQVRIRFNESVEAAFSPMEVFNQQGKRVDLDDANTDPDNSAVLVASLNPNLPSGTYTVKWRVTSADGHPINGKYKFTVKSAGEAGESQPAGTREQEQAASQEKPKPAARGGSGSGSSTANSVWLYSGIGLGALAVVALVGVALQRRGKP
ncbi:MAG TPA: copper resistance protein CopC [Rubrobacteraceae bacterium]|nr:copper resistance protein CopC [Rubrobacteraceae bacterium]